MTKRSIPCCGYKIKIEYIIIFLLIVISIHLGISSYTVEGFTTNITNNVLVGVGANYQLAVYIGTTWKEIETPQGLAKAFLLAVAIGPDGNLYGIGNDFHLYRAGGGTWIKTRQPSSLQFISLAMENNQLVGIGTDYKLYVYDIPTALVNPVPGDTGPVISVLSYKGTEFGVGKDHKLYKWINDNWVLYDGNAPTKNIGLINIAEVNGKIYGIGTDKKMYIYGGAPGHWTEAAGNKGIKLISIFSMTHTNYLKFGFT